MQRLVPISRHSSAPLLRSPAADPQLPANVLNLVGREREVAIIVYAQGASTAKAVEAALSATISNCAVRSMLTRLVRKGVLRREFGGRGRKMESVYLPGITSEHVQDDAIRTICRRYFEGSLTSVGLRVLDLLAQESATTRHSPDRERERNLSRRFQSR